MPNRTDLPGSEHPLEDSTAILLNREYEENGAPPVLNVLSPKMACPRDEAPINRVRSRTRPSEFASRKRVIPNVMAAQ
jgi:hypothetical protein